MSYDRTDLIEGKFNNYFFMENLFFKNNIKVDNKPQFSTISKVNIDKLCQFSNLRSHFTPGLAIAIAKYPFSLSYTLRVYLHTVDGNRRVQF